MEEVCLFIARTSKRSPTNFVVNMIEVKVSGIPISMKNGSVIETALPMPCPLTFRSMNK